MADFKIDIKIKVEEVVKDMKNLGDAVVKDLKKQIGVFKMELVFWYRSLFRSQSVRQFLILLG